MNYKESSQILEKISAAKRVLVACHASPDPDSVGSVLSMNLALKQLGIKTTLFCIDTIPSTLSFLAGSEEILTTDLKEYVFRDDDLFLIVDMGDWQMLFGETSLKNPSCNIIRIDHHKTGNINAPLSIVKSTKSSTCEILFGVFEDWGIKINPQMATCLLTGIIGDTGSFQYELTKSSTHLIASKLYEEGANHNEIYFNLYKSAKFDSYKLLGYLLRNMVLEADFGFVWTAVPYTEFEKVRGAEKDPLKDVIIQSVSGTKFGMRMVEDEPGVLYVAFRSRYPGKVDVSLLAQKFGGGGHMAAAGARLEGPFSECVKKVLFESKQFSKTL